MSIPTSVAKVVMRAMKRNDMAIIKAMAQKMRMSRGKLVSQAKKVSRKTPKTKKMSKRETVTRAKSGQST
tara:strand:+ start:810 stop:1019 length:210 start_codon:yes stop_codon:yes gene_type:complete